MDDLFEFTYIPQHLADALLQRPPLEEESAEVGLDLEPLLLQTPEGAVVDQVLVLLGAVVVRGGVVQPDDLPVNRSLSTKIVTDDRCFGNITFLVTFKELPLPNPSLPFP